MTPRFSIIIPCYNAADTLGATLDSLAAQTETDWTAVCVDDGSTDATWALLCDAARRDPRIQPVRNCAKGPSAARNQGALQDATGDIIAFCDADDLWKPGKLADLAKVFEDQSIAAAFGRIGFFANDPAQISAQSTPPSGDLTVATLLGENPVCTMSNIAVRRSVFVETAGFDETLVHNEDLEWLIRLVAGGHRTVPIHRLQVLYRTSTGGLSADFAAMARSREQALAKARLLGFASNAGNEAIYYRYLARRALRVDAGATVALRLTLRGILSSPTAFLMPMRRGVPIAASAVLRPFLAAPLRRRLFAF